jgi:hypothetical protein
MTALSREQARLSTRVSPALRHRPEIAGNTLVDLPAGWQPATFR